MKTLFSINKAAKIDGMPLFPPGMTTMLDRDNSSRRCDARRAG
jgi:hypothetical protein